MLISIIVAVYNTEKYLEKCLESIINQTYQNIEILLINDGSTDISGKICDEYAKKDSRISVYHQSNRGVSAVRQFGIGQAKGEYSIHVDSDDWVEKNMLEEMCYVAKKDNCDVLITDFFYDNGEKFQLSIDKPTTLEPYSIISDICKGKVSSGVCNKLIRHNLYNKFLISFSKRINYGEDQLVLIQLLMNVKKVSYLNKSYYYYYCNSESITKKVDKDFFSSKISPFITELEIILKDKSDKFIDINNNKLLLKNYLIDSNCFTFKKLKRIYPETNSHILSSSLDLKIKIKLFLINKNLGILMKWIQVINKTFR
jgi:glycosyltransferase involved in cell wall biosynthesis